MNEQDQWRRAFAAARAATREALDALDEDGFRHQIHSGFSPLGWHYGHIAFTEAQWLLVQDGGLSMPRPELRDVFAVDALPKSARGCLPPWSEIDDYAEEVRAAVLERIGAGAARRNPRLWHFVLQHESQHCETMTFLRWLASGHAAARGTGAMPPMRETVTVPAGPFVMGSDEADALDNERPAHLVDLPAFEIDRWPVTQYDYNSFIAAGGYGNRQLWSEAGWAWRESAAVERPLYWVRDGDALPVSGVSYYEAEAYAAFRGARLPTEAEWEKASRPKSSISLVAPGGGFDRRRGGPEPVGRHPEFRSDSGCEDMLGGVWEWTATIFDGFSSFEPYPYDGYSADYFDGRHFVIKGGSWATRAPVLRSTFRNWYMPDIREILVGFRCVEGSL